jgi:hypothetical protein
MGLRLTRYTKPHARQVTPTKASPPPFGLVVRSEFLHIEPCIWAAV